jgi:hypothetical protein
MACVHYQDISVKKVVVIKVSFVSLALRCTAWCVGKLFLPNKKRSKRTN